MNARTSSGVLLVFFWNGIDVIFLIKKLHLCHPKGYRYNFLITSMPFQENTRKTSGDALAILLFFCAKSVQKDSRRIIIDALPIISHLLYISIQLSFKSIIIYETTQRRFHKSNSRFRNKMGRKCRNIISIIFTMI